MKISLLCFFLFSVTETSFSQIETDSTGNFNFRFSVTYNLNTDIPGEKNLDDHRVDDLSGFEETDRVATPLHGFFATLTIMPENDYKAMIVRLGKMVTSYEYKFTTLETDISGSPIGNLKTTIVERYAVYPLSIGGVYTTPKQELQLFAEMIYALGYLNEEYTITTTSGGTTGFSSSYTGTALGYQLGVIVNPQLGSTFGLHLEGGYRGLRFYQFEDRNTNIVIPLDLSLSSAYLNFGITFML